MLIEIIGACVNQLDAFLLILGRAVLILVAYLVHAGLDAGQLLEQPYCILLGLLKYLFLYFVEFFLTSNLLQVLRQFQYPLLLGLVCLYVFVLIFAVVVVIVVALD